MSRHTEIERKWKIDRGVPLTFPVVGEGMIERTFLSVEPEVRLSHRVARQTEHSYNLTVKSGGFLSREEVRIILSEDDYHSIRKIFPVPPLVFHTKTLIGDGGLRIGIKECVQLDLAFAEIEFRSVEESHSMDRWRETVPFFEEEVTGVPRYYVKNMWLDYLKLLEA